MRMLLLRGNNGCTGEKFKETQAVERRQWQALAGLPGGFAKLVPSSREFLQIRTMVAELPGV